MSFEDKLAASHPDLTYAWFKKNYTGKAHYYAHEGAELDELIAYATDLGLKGWKKQFKSIGA